MTAQQSRDMRQRLERRWRKIHHEALGAEVAPELLAKQRLNVGLVIDDKNRNAHVGPLLQSCL